MATDYARRRKWEVYRETFPTIFWTRVDSSAGPDACWPYLGSKRSNGYGRLRIRGKYVLAHRVAYGLAKCEVPDGLMVCHACDNPACCNPAHLWLGTHTDNMRDRSAKGRAPVCEGHSQAKLTAEQVGEIRVRLSRGEMPWRMAADYGVHPTAIYRIRDGRTWSALKARAIHTVAA